MPSRDDWALAYAAQSQSDWGIYWLLVRHRPPVPACHELHYLQMATEKIAKAYMFRDTATREQGLQQAHVAFSKMIGMFLKSPQVKAWYRNRPSDLSEIAVVAHRLARSIEKLNPAVDREGSPTNVEYPWESGGAIHVPCQQTVFPTVRPLEAGAGLASLRLVGKAVEDFASLRLL